MDIDLVYLWVDGSDPTWRKKHDEYVGKLSNREENCEGRYADNDELKYSLRSVEKYAPWLRKIFIVTDNQIPTWLDTTNPKIQIVDHTEFIPKEYLPCFSPRVIEHHLYNILGLSEHFLFANDDMFFNRPVSPSTFFTDEGLPIVRLNRRPFRKLMLWYREKVLGKQLSNHNRCIQNAARLVEQRYGKYYSGKMHHNIDAYSKSTYRHAREVFDEEIRPTLTNHARSSNDIQRHIYTYVALAEKKGHVCYVNQHTSFRFHIDNPRHYEKFLRYNPLLFCMNDSQYATSEDRRRSAEFLSQLFPEKSQFEK